ncbi:Chromo domain-containing protein [Mycena venus]|uniref:Chromo domain-containing protein n=1 Tax=Mycena venus TaxID=2733690 RepID=A0A8H6U1M1_9AGAR|nr:Chromo domain-containing protein [Mycena venus]
MPATRTNPRWRASGSTLSEPSTSSSSLHRSSRFPSRDASESSLTSCSPSPPPEPKKIHGTITIRGQKLQPTVVLNTLWYWIAERKAIDDRRRAGVPAPWTTDPIFRDFKFCNAYRVLDRTSQFVVAEVVEKGSHLSDTELLFRILLFNAFNRIETWELLQKEFGVRLTWKDYNIHAYNKVLTKAKNRGMSLFTSAYMKIGKKMDYEANHMRHLQLLEILMKDLPGILATSEYAVEVYEELAGYPGMAEFTAYQLMISLSYSRLLNFCANDFVVAGPGASSGLVKMFGSSLVKAKYAVPDIESDIIRWMVETQCEHFDRLDLEFPFLRGANGKERKLDVADMEHAVCEVDKYARKAHPGVRGIGGRTQLRGTFHASPDVLPKTPILPTAWEDPARKVMRVRPGPIVVEQKWIVLKILDDRPAQNGNHDDAVEYLMDWLGYKPTWEPRYSVVLDAPALVAEYQAGLAKKKAKKARR